MEIDELRNVDIRNAVAIGEAERLFILEVTAGTQQTATGHGFFAGVDERDAPRLAVILVHVHAVFTHVEGDVRGVQEVVGEEVLDRIALVAEADHEVVNSVGGILLHDVPENWLAADLDHWLGLEVRLFTDARAEATRQNNCLHRLPSCSSPGCAWLS
ncbi:hypothetical protein D3C72_1349330 [compost metagenome]